MKKMRNSKTQPIDAGDLLPEYKIDYSKARPNRFAARFNKVSVAVVLDPDIARVFRTPASVNAALRSLLPRVMKARRLSHSKI